MLVSSYYKNNVHVRTRNERKETIKTRQKVYILQCDSCGDVFEKTSKNYKPSQSHCCCNCNHYKLAQQASVKQKRINKYVDQFDASSGRPIGTFIVE